MNSQELASIKACLSARNLPEIKALITQGKIEAYVETAPLNEKNTRIKRVLSSLCSDAIKEIKAAIKVYVEEAPEAEKSLRVKDVLSSHCVDAIKEIKAAIKVYVEEATEAEKALRVKNVLSSGCADAIKEIKASVKAYVDGATDIDEKATRIKDVLSSGCPDAIKKIKAAIKVYVEEAPEAEKALRVKNVLSSQCIVAIKEIKAAIKVYVEEAPEAEKALRVKDVLSVKCADATKEIKAAIEVYVEEAPEAEKALRIKNVLSSTCSELIDLLANSDAIVWYLTSSETHEESLERLRRVICSRIKEKDLLTLVPNIIVEKNIVIESLNLNKFGSPRLGKLIQEVNKLRAQAAAIDIDEGIAAGLAAPAASATQASAAEYSVASLFGPDPIASSLAAPKVTGKKRKKPETDETDTESKTDEPALKNKLLEQKLQQAQCAELLRREG